MSDRERIIEERRQRFIEKYKEAFGVEPELEPLMTPEQILASGEYTLVLNYYGIKSPWM